ncbi:MAG: NAD(P)H-dependent oxidoreductase [Pseudomonadota bacterium]
MTKIALLQGHPDPAGGHLCHALAESYLDGARQAGHEIANIEIAALEFPLLRTQADWHRGQGATPPGLLTAQQQCVDAQHIVIVFPLWLGTLPALLKGFFEQAFRPGVALSYGESLPAPLFKGKSARIVVTMGMPSIAYRLYYRAHGVKNLERSILRFAGVKPVRTSLFGMVEQRPDTRRQAWLTTMRRLGQRAV